MNGVITTTNDVDVACDPETEELLKKLWTCTAWTNQTELACRGIARVIELQLEILQSINPKENKK